jgi:DNA-binding transcriptional regulator PaaX
MVIDSKRITVEGLLRYVDAELEVMFPVTRKEVYRQFYCPKSVNWKDFFPSVVERKLDALKRKGLVVCEETEEGIRVKITDRGRMKVLEYHLRDLKPKSGKWDGKWRMVFFDIGNVDSRKRDMLRLYLKQLGMRKIQASVYICPYDVLDEVRYLREILNVPHVVKTGVLTELENEEEIREIFGV